jgi:hypothetical protein
LKLSPTQAERCKESLRRFRAAGAASTMLHLLVAVVLCTALVPTASATEGEDLDLWDCVKCVQGQGNCMNCLSSNPEGRYAD